MADFAELKERVSIEQVAELLDLATKKSGNQLRCECPVHGGGERGMVITPSKGLFYCFKGESGGDLIRLYAHVHNIADKEAGNEIEAQVGKVQSNSTSTVNRTSSTPTTNEPPPEPSRFDPEKFRKQLIWHESLAKQNLTPEIAESLAIGYHPQRKRIFYASRHPSGEIAGFRDDTGKPPPQWLPASTTVVKFPKRA